MAGEGGLFRRKRTRPDGTEYVRWVAQVSYGGRHDRHVVRRFRRTKAEARAALAEMLGPRQSPQPLGDFLGYWLAEVAGPAISPNTARVYAAIIASAGPLHAIPLADLTEQDIEGWLNRLEAKRRHQREAKPASAKTRHNALAMLRRALSVAHRRGLVARNVADLVEMPRLRAVPRAAFTADDVRGILAATVEDRYAAAYALGLCGLRSGEVLGLAWDDVDLDAGIVTIRHQLRGSGKRGALVPTKTAGSAAAVPIPAIVVERLRTHRAGQLEERVKAGQPTEDGLVFVTPDGLPVNGSWLTKHLKRVLVVGKQPERRFHDLRHATADILAAAGVHPRVAQQYLRHARVLTTLETYTAVQRGQEREAADALQAAMG